MALLLVTNQVENQNNAPLTANDQTGSSVTKFEGSQGQRLSKDANAEEKASSNEIISSDTNEVNWDGPDDVQNPQNWPVWRRTVIVGTVRELCLPRMCMHSSHLQTHTVLVGAYSTFSFISDAPQPFQVRSFVNSCSHSSRKSCRVQFLKARHCCNACCNNRSKSCLLSTTYICGSLTE